MDVAVSENKMSFSINTVLKLLVERFEADLSISENATPAERRCFETLEAVLLTTAQKHSPTPVDVEASADRQGR